MASAAPWPFSPSASDTTATSSTAGNASTRTGPTSRVGSSRSVSAAVTVRVTSCWRPAKAPPTPKNSAHTTANAANSVGPSDRPTTTSVTQPSTPVASVLAADQATRRSVTAG